MSPLSRSTFLKLHVWIVCATNAASVLSQIGQPVPVIADSPLTPALPYPRTMLANLKASLSKRVMTRLLPLLSLGGLVLTTACATLPSSGRSIYESPDAVVRLEPASKVSPSDDANCSHPALLTMDQIDVLLTSISARSKVGLLRTLISDPGTPRLFDRTDIGLLANPIQEALAQASPGEAVVFYRIKNRRGARALVTSGVLFVCDEVFIFRIANFWHPVITIASDVGSKTRLEDVRETTAYVLDHAWVSVGEQDFAIFFDDPKYQLSRLESSLWDHPERTVAIAYPLYIQANPDPARRARESAEAVQQATMPKTQIQAITDLRKRLLELEQRNTILAERIQNSSGAPTPPDSHPAIPSPPQTKQVSTDKLLEIIERLENRVKEMEQQLRTKSPRVNDE